MMMDFKKDVTGLFHKVTPRSHRGAQRDYLYHVMNEFGTPVDSL